MDSERVLRSRKQYSSKKSIRYSELAHCRWSKTHGKENDDGLTESTGERMYDEVSQENSDV